AAEPPAGSRSPYARIVGLTVAGALAGSVAGFAWPQTFTATAEMLIAPTEAASTTGSTPFPGDVALAVVDNQLRVLRSGTMLTAAAERLNLAADAEFNGEGGLLAGLGTALASDGGA